MKSLRLLVCTVLLAMAGLALPTGASASSTQLSLIQDDRELYGLSGRDPAAVMQEIRDLGVDVVRTNVIFYKVFRQPSLRKRPGGFVASDPSSPFYDWSQVDRVVSLAREKGIQVLLTITGPGPHFTSSSPRRCRKVPCSFKPRPKDFGAFAAAVAKRYAGRVDYYSIWNEPNIGKTWLTPRFTRTRAGRVDAAGALYRKLFIAGYRSIAKFDRARRNRVLFGETAAIGSPLPMLYAALCLDSKGRPFKGKLKSAHGCSGKVRKLNIGGFAVHPYNQGAYGTPQSKTKTKTSLSLAYMPRLHRLASVAARRGRIPGGRGIYMTEFGFQTRPPDPFGVSVANQARYLNESDRLFYSDRRVKAVAQYELYDVRFKEQFNSGLRFADGSLKPAYEAYRVPIVVTRRSSGSVEVYGQARPARLAPPGSSAQIAIQADTGSGFQTVRTVFGNARGIFRTNVSLGGASSASWRLVYQAPNGALLTSRVARAGSKLKYRKG
jgi:hypothetical protein